MNGDKGDVRSRVVRFSLASVVALLAPFMVLPIVASKTSVADWAALAVGQSIGTFAGLLVACGWAVNGPVEIARASGNEIVGIFRESVRMRLIAFVATAVPVVAVCGVASPDGRFTLTATTAVAFSSLGLSSTWVAVGLGDPVPLVLLESLPRLAILAASALAISLGATVLVYPGAVLLASLVGLGLFTWAGVHRIRPPASPRPSMRARIATQLPAIATTLSAGGYAAVTVFLVSLATDVRETALLSSAQLLYGVGLVAVVALSSALQSWVIHPDPATARERRRKALASHACLGLAGLAAFTVLAPPVAARLFGADVAPGATIAAGYGVALLATSIGTSLAQHLLVPAGAVDAVLRATVTGAGVGVPLILVLSSAFGAAGGAFALAASELLVTGVMAAAARRRLATPVLQTRSGAV